MCKKIILIIVTLLAINTTTHARLKLANGSVENRVHKRKELRIKNNRLDTNITSEYFELKNNKQDYYAQKEIKNTRTRTDKYQQWHDIKKSLKERIQNRKTSRQAKGFKRQKIAPEIKQNFQNKKERTHKYESKSSGFKSADSLNCRLVGLLEYPCVEDMELSSCVAEANYAYVSGYSENGAIIVLDVSDTADIRKVGQIATGTEYIFSLFKSGNYLYAIGVNEEDDEGRFQIIDVSDPTHPTNTGGLCFADTWCADIYVQANYAYLAVGVGLYIINISNPQIPLRVGYLPLYGCERVFVSGNYAYVIKYDEWPNPAKLVIIDVSNPSSPQAHGEISTGMQWSSDVAVRDNYAYVCGSKFLVIDISNPNNPIQVAYLPGPDGSSIELSGNYAYVAESDLFIIDITNPLNPFTVAEFGNCYCNEESDGLSVQGTNVYITSEGWCFLVIDCSDFGPPIVGQCGNEYYGEPAIFYKENYGYVTSQWDDLKIFDLTDPANPYEAGYASKRIRASDVFVKDTFAYIPDSDNGLRIVNIANPSQPFEVGNCDVPINSAYQIYVKDSFAYITNLSGLYIFNISNPSEPYIVSYYYNGDGIPWKVFIKDTFAYVTDVDNYSSNGGLRIINIANPRNPYEVGHYHGYARDVYVKDTFAYLACGSAGFHIVNVARPNNPIQIGCYVGAGSVWDVFVKDSLAYINVGYGCLCIINIARPNSPFQVGSYPCYNARDIYVKDTFAYVPCWFNLRIINVSDPTNPFEAGCSDTLNHALGVYVQGSFAYVACYYEGIRIINVSDPTNPLQTGNYTPTIFCPYDVFVKDTFAYVANNGYDYEGMTIINIKDPIHPVEIAFCQTPHAYGVYVQDTFAYIASECYGLRIINVSDPTNPFEVGYYYTPGYALSVYVSGSYAYVAAGSAGLRIINVSNPASPYEVGYCYTPGYAQDVYVSGSYAYVANGWEGLRIINVSNPASPYEVGYYIMPWEESVRGVFVKNYIAYVTTNRGLLIINVSSPSNPVRIGTASVLANDVWVEGIYAYVVGEAGLKVIDISNPFGGLYVAGFYYYEEEENHIRDVKVFGSYAYLASDYGLQCVDISDRTNPRCVGLYPINPSLDAQTLDIKFPYAYISAYNWETGFDSLFIINISNPTNPFRVSAFADSIQSIKVVGNYAYLCEVNHHMWPYRGGIRIIDISNPAYPTPIGYCNLSDDTTYGMPSSIAVSGPYAFVNCRVYKGYPYYTNSVGLYVINISNPYNPQKISFTPIDSAQEAYGISVSANYACLATGGYYCYGGVYIFDISNPYAPIKKGRYQAGNYPPEDVFVQDSFAYVAYGRYGLRIINISNPQHPFLYGYYQPVSGANYYYRVSVSGTYVYLIDPAWSSLSIIQISGFTPPPQVWVPISPLPTQVPNKYVRDGGALVANGSNIYAFRGNNSREFYRYDGSKWDTMKPIPWYVFETKTIKKNVKKGGALCSDGADNIYAIKGGGTREFWVYHIPSDSWTRLPDVGNQTTKLRGGSALAFYQGKVYCLVGGSQTREFYAYDTSTKIWSLKSAPPAVDNKKYKEGSALVLTETLMYVLRGGAKIGEFYSYNPNTDQWNHNLSETIPAKHPFSPLGKKLIKNGAALTYGDGIIYAVKGGGSNEFWAYSPVTKWQPLSLVPRLNNDKKSVIKGGGALCYVNSAIYLLKGNNRNEFWQYSVASKVVAKDRPIVSSICSSIMAEQAGEIINPSFNVMPNPCDKFTIIRYSLPIPGHVTIKLYRPTGELIETIINNYSDAGIFARQLQTKHLAKGIYFLKYETNTHKKEIKLVIQ